MLASVTICQSTVLDGFDAALPVADKIDLDAIYLLAPRLVRRPCHYARRLFPSTNYSAYTCKTQNQGAMICLHLCAHHPVHKTLIDIPRRSTQKVNLSRLTLVTTTLSHPAPCCTGIWGVHCAESVRCQNIMRLQPVCNKDTL